MNQSELEQLVQELAMAETDAAKHIIGAENASEKRLQALKKQLEEKAEQEIQKLAKKLARDREERLQALNREIGQMEQSTARSIETMRKAQEGVTDEIVDWAVERITAI